MELEPRVIDDVVARLRRVEGQVGGIIRMIEGGRECRDVVRQISAASKALDQAGFKLIAAGLLMCLRDQKTAQRAGYTEEEMERLFLRLA